MTDTPLSRRAFFGTAAAVGVVGALPASEAKPSPLAPEPTPPVGVSQRLGSARFRELTADYKFSADSKWLAQFDGGHFLAYEVATGRRVKWAAKGDEAGWPDWHLANDTVLLWDNNHPAPVPTLWDRDTGHPRKALKFKPAQHHALTADASGLIQYDGKELRRVDVRTGKVEWRRAWKCDASVPVVEYTVTQRWIVGVGVKRLHLFNPLTGKDGPRLEDAPPPDAPPDNHFQPVGFSADNKRLCGYFTADAQPRTVVWDLTTGKVVGRRTMTDTTEPPLLTADGRTLLILDQQARLSGCDVTTGKLTRRLAAQNIGQFVLSPDGAVLAVGWGQQFGPLGGIGAFGGIVGPAAGEGVIRLLNPATGELLLQSPDPSAEVKGVRFADPHSVVTEVDAASSQSSHLVWDVRTGRRRAAINANHPNFGAGLPAPFLCAGFGFNGRQDELSPDGTRCLAEFQSQVVVADAFTGRALHAFDPIQSVEPLFWLGRGKVAKLSAGGLVVWDLDGHTRRTIPLKFNQAGTAVTPDGRTAVFSHSDQDAEEPTAITWVDAASGAVTRRPVERGRMAVSADGNRVAVTVGADAIPEYEGFIRVTVIDRGSRRISFRQATGNVVNEPRAELSPCGRTAYLAHEKPGEGETAEGIPVVQFWEVLSGERRAEYVTPFAAGGLGVSPCGRRVATHPPRRAGLPVGRVRREDRPPNEAGQEHVGRARRPARQGVRRHPAVGAAPGRGGGVVECKVDPRRAAEAGVGEGPHRPSRQHRLPRPTRR